MSSVVNLKNELKELSEKRDQRSDEQLNRDFSKVLKVGSTLVAMSQSMCGTTPVAQVQSLATSSVGTETIGGKQELNEIKIYSKESFDRFGDDLCEVLLSYLSFEDKFTFECLSKPTQRCVYEKQYKLSINKKMSNSLIAFEAMIEKLRNINAIEFENSINSENANQIMDLTVNYCLKFIKINCNTSNMSEECIDRFFYKMATNLKTFSFEDNYDLEEKLNLCTNLIELNLKSYDDYCLADLSEESIDSMNKLSKISFKYCYCSECKNIFEYLVNKCKNRLKSIEVKVDRECDEKDINLLMNGLKQMSKLIHLGFDFSPKKDKFLIEGLTQIGLKCLELKSFRLYMFSPRNVYLCQIIDTINDYFKRLNRLDLNIHNIQGIESDSLSEWLSECKQLTHLTLDSSRCYFKDSFFEDIEIHLPKLQFLSLNETKITDSAINSLTKLSKLQTIIINNNGVIADSSVYELINKCNKIRKVVINIDSYELLL